jgi:internalin A
MRTAVTSAGSRLRRAAALAITLLAAACADYSVTFNERPLFTPPGLFADFEFADAALAECVAQHIVDQSVTRAEELVRLNCSHAGVQDLEGLQLFAGLRHLSLSANAIADVSPLAGLAQLETLLLADNLVEDAADLWQLPALTRLDLSGNPGLICPRADEGAGVAELTLPAHCA